MTLYLRLYWEFFKTGLFAIGGGMATLPFLKDIGAACGLHAAADALHAVDDLFVFHAAHQGGNALKVAVASAQKFYINDASGITRQADDLAARALCVINNLFHLRCMGVQ